MIARTERREYYCSTWDRHRVRGDLAKCPCERNGVRQAVLEEFISKYLDETGRRLDHLVVGPDAGDLTGKLRGDLNATHDAFIASYFRVLDYINQHNPAAGTEVLGEPCDPKFGPPLLPVEHAVELYRRCFDPARAAARLAELEARHTKRSAQPSRIVDSLTGPFAVGIRVPPSSQATDAMSRLDPASRSMDSNVA
jgi:hypothetical protein